MPSTFPGEPDDLAAVDLTHGDVTDALAAVQVYLDGSMLDIESTENINAAPDPPTGKVRILVFSSEGLDAAPVIRVGNTDGWSAYLTTFEEIAGSFMQLFSQVAPPGTMYVAWQSGVPGVAETNLLFPGTDGQVLTADSTSAHGLAYADPHILISTPGGVAYRLVVADDGTLSTEAV